jgi:hypothetical protein
VPFRRQAALDIGCVNVCVRDADSVDRVVTKADSTNARAGVDHRRDGLDQRMPGVHDCDLHRAEADTVAPID